MLSLRILSRNSTPQVATSIQRFHIAQGLFDSSSDSDSSDDEKKRKKFQQPAKEIQSEKSKQHLNSLVAAMINGTKTGSKADVAFKSKKSQASKGAKQKGSTAPGPQPFEKKLAGAAKDVASLFGGNVQQTESELLKKMLTPSPKSSEPVDLSKLILGMKIDRTKGPTNVESSSRAHQVRTVLERNRQPSQDQYKPTQSQYRPTQSQYRPTQPWTERRDNNRMSGVQSRINLDSGTPLNYFSRGSEQTSQPETGELSTWNELEKRELRLTVTHPPINFLDQMIRWTEQGKLWRFPIDNEQDFGSESEVHFSEHIFLEQHLENWCPRKGPVRHFMELVCVGLSKNPYLTAREKKEHIYWFKDYFEKKQDLLKDLGAYDLTGVKPAEKQIEA